MPYQSADNLLVALRRETAINVQATATGATQVRVLDSPGLELKRAPIQSQEIRSDLLMSMPRTGYESVDGSYNTEMSIGGHLDLLIESVMRSAWATATSFSFASVTTVAIGTSTLTPGGSSSFITAGVRVGDIFYLSSTTVSADNSINVPVLAIASLSGGAITVPAGTFTTLAATATGTLTILKKIKTPTTITNYSYSIEQNNADMDLSELFTGCRVVGAKFSFKPGQPATVAFTFMGVDRVALATGTSPYFTSPTLTTGLTLIAEDSSIRKNGASAATFTGFDLDFTIKAAGQPVLGSVNTPEIFTNSLNVSGSVSGLRSDFSNLTLFDGETEFEIMIKLEEPNTGPPKSCFNIFLPRVKIGGIGAPLGGGDGGQIETLTLWVGPKTAAAATGVDGTIATFSSSAA